MIKALFVPWIMFAIHHVRPSRYGLKLCCTQKGDYFYSKCSLSSLQSYSDLEDTNFMSVQYSMHVSNYLKKKKMCMPALVFETIQRKGHRLLIFFFFFLSFISQSLFINHLVNITAPTAWLNKSLIIWWFWGYSTSGLQVLLAWEK